MSVKRSEAPEVDSNASTVKDNNISTVPVRSPFASRDSNAIQPNNASANTKSLQSSSAHELSQNRKVLRAERRFTKTSAEDAGQVKKAEDDDDDGAPPKPVFVFGSKFKGADLS